jgi:uncharacterized protein (TIGR00369 family)
LPKNGEIEMAKKAGPKHGLKNYQYPDKFGKMLGYKVTVADKTHFRAETVLRVREQHLSPAKRLHGGVVSAFFDYSMGAAVFTTLHALDFCSTVELKVNYLKPILLGDFLTSKTEVMFRGKRLCVVRGLIYKNDEKAPVAMASGTFNIVSGEEAAKRAEKSAHGAEQAAAQKGATGSPRTVKARSK